MLLSSSSTSEFSSSDSFLLLLLLLMMGADALVGFGMGGSSWGILVDYNLSSGMLSASERGR